MAAMTEASDHDLVALARRGDRDAFGRLVLRHQDKIYNVVVRTLGSRDQAEDVCQRAFLNAYLRLGAFKGNAAFSTWLYRIAFNESISFLRYEGRRRGPSLDGPEERGLPEPAFEAGGDPAGPLSRTEDEQIVHEALKALAPEDRQVLVLREMEGLPYQEIAKVLGVPVGTVRSRLFRARESLRERLRVLLGTPS